MLLMIDNYDSFTFNLVQYLQVLGAELEVVRNDALTVKEIARRAPSHVRAQAQAPVDVFRAAQLLRTPVATMLD